MYNSKTSIQRPTTTYDPLGMFEDSTAIQSVSYKPLNRAHIYNTQPYINGTRVCAVSCYLVILARNRNGSMT